MKWISVEDRLPETEGIWSKDDVLVLTTYAYEIGRTKNSKWVDMDNRNIDATHWMPLPEPPEDK